ncbi:hypothetical protein GDO81_019988 [Engystomops pustulosus]|uniref:Uncharacterized protein n=1 Tax=Engystomops pustulosus TaxID=76066 RepID=A0AAV6YRV6_ENGPU|nr:hypothetical protein GDO81_019988 [Engystomops pustulosus]
MSKAFPALGAHEWLLSGVDPLMYHQIGVVGEAFATYGAGEELLSGVDPLVYGQAGLVEEELPALWTGHLTPIVHGLVLDEAKV